MIIYYTNSMFFPLSRSLRCHFYSGNNNKKKTQHKIGTKKKKTNSFPNKLYRV